MDGDMVRVEPHRPESVLAVAERLGRHAKKTARGPHAADLRLAAKYLRAYASALIAEEARACSDAGEREALMSEADELRAQELREERRRRH
jgi:hypothetical protein